MSKIYFHSDISCQEIKDIENENTLRNDNQLIDKASDYICKIITTKFSVKDKIIFVCGPGSNGLDGIYSAYKLLKHKFNVEVYLINDKHHQLVHELALGEHLIKDFDCDRYDCIIDCMFGYGLNRLLNQDIIQLINKINSSNSFILSIDVPSGLNPETGSLCPVSIKCNLLISLLSYKRGVFTNFGRDTWRDILYSNLNIKEIKSKNILVSANPKFNGYSYAKEFKSTEAESIHKKSNGISCVIAGQQPYHGAMLLSVAAAMKAGCKYLEVYTEDEYAHSLPMIMPEVIAKCFSLNDFEKNISNYKNILIGPGMKELNNDYLDVIMNNLNKIDSVIVDAGALKALKKNIYLKNQVIITPHPGEAAYLLNVDTKDIQDNRYEAAKLLHDYYNCIVILKGSGTIIYDGKQYVTCMDGNHRMSVAGMGDTLSGLLLYEMSSNQDSYRACLKATTFHSYAADCLLYQSRIKNYLPSMIPDLYNKITN